MRRINAENLIALAIATLKSEIQPALPADKRYALAMSLKALEVARSEIQTDSDAAVWDTLDAVYDDGEGTLEMLSSDIRAGKVSDATHPELRARLERMLVRELEIRNPRALTNRTA